MERRITLPLTKEKAAALKSGDACLLTGTVYAMRDATHKRLTEQLKNGEKPPFELADAVVYYMGPSPANPGQIIGAAGPTTAGRMDSYTPELLARGLRGMIGKGARSEAVVRAMKETGAVYFGAIGGAGALLASKITSSEIIAYEDLGAEAIYKLEVEDFPVTVVIDTTGESLYETGRAKYQAHIVNYEL
jgi:fumarate hydratase subunit beta